MAAKARILAFLSVMIAVVAIAVALVSVAGASPFVATLSHTWNRAATNLPETPAQCTGGGIGVDDDADTVIDDGCQFANNQPPASTAVSYVSTYAIPAPDANFAGVFTTTAPPEFSLAAGTTISKNAGGAADGPKSGGTSMGSLSSVVKLGLFNTGCSTTLTVPIDFFNATTDTTDAADWLSDGSNLAADTDPVDRPADVLNGIPQEADHYPSYLNSIFDQDGPNGVQPPARPFQRLYGQVIVTPGSPPTHLNFNVFAPDQFQNLSASLVAGQNSPLNGIPDSDGFLNVVVLNNPTQPAAPSPVTDFCTGLSSTTVLNAKTDGELHVIYPNICADALDNDADGKVNDGCPTIGTPEEATGAGPNCNDGVDNDADGWINDGCNKQGANGEQAPECINNLSNNLDDDGDTTVDDGCIQKARQTPAVEPFGERCDGVDNDGDTTVDEGCGSVVLTTSAAGKGIGGTDTHLLRVYAQALREFNDKVGAGTCPAPGFPGYAQTNDCVENALDPCPLTDTTTAGWDPRAAAPGNDTDADGLPDDCDPAPLVPSTAALVKCGGGAGFGDEDQDCFPNRADNCPQVWNGDNPNTPRIEGQEDFDTPAGRLGAADFGSRSDSIGDACEPGNAVSGTAEADGTCSNATSDDGTDESPARVNDGCPAVGPTESGPIVAPLFDGGANCTNAVDDDGDTIVNDGCPQRGNRAEGDQCRGDPADGVGSGLDDDGDTVVDDGCGYDNDGDAAINEDPKNGADNDGDGIIDEDPGDDYNGSGGTADEAALPGGVTNRSTVVGEAPGGITEPVSAVCLSTSADADADGYCDATETMYGSNPASAASKPEAHAFTLGLPGATEVCNDGIDNDGDTTIDAADVVPAGLACGSPGDVDDDNVPDGTDNCVTARNPEQLNTDGDATGSNGTGGDECDIDDDGDTLVDVAEYARGTNPKVVNTDGVGGSDRADTVTGGAGDPDGDGFSSGVERVLGTDPNKKCVNSAAPGTTAAVNQRWDADPLDINRDGNRNVTDVLKMKGRTPSAVNETFPTEVSPAFAENRLDLDGSGTLNVTDVLKFKGATPASSC